MFVKNDADGGYQTSRDIRRRINTAKDVKAAWQRAINQHELFVSGDIASALARGPSGFDREKRDRVLGHFASWCNSGNFADHEMLVLGGDPPRLQLLKKFEKKYRESAPSSLVTLIPCAARRFLEQSIEDQAPVFVRVWFPTSNNLLGGPILAATRDSGSSSGDSGDSSKPRPTDVWPDRGKPDVSTQIGVVHAAPAEKPTIPEAMLKAYFQTERDNGHIPAADPSKLALEQQYPHYKVPRKLVRTAHQQVFPGTPAGKRQSRR